jgi:hypothetical protein
MAVNNKYINSINVSRTGMVSIEPDIVEIPQRRTIHQTSVFSQDGIVFAVETNWTVVKLTTLDVRPADVFLEVVVLLTDCALMVLRIVKAVGHYLLNLDCDDRS